MFSGFVVFFDVIFDVILITCTRGASVAKSTFGAPRVSTEGGYTEGGYTEGCLQGVDVILIQVLM